MPPLPQSPGNFARPGMGRRARNRCRHYLATALLLWAQRSALPVRFIHLEGLVAPRLAWFAKTGIPATLLSVSTHSVTGATAEIVPVVPSSNPATTTVGDTFVWVFRTTGEKADSYSVRGLPPGVYLSAIVDQGISSLSGTPAAAGTYRVYLTGWEHPGARGDSTAPYELTINVAEGEPPVIDTPLSGGGEYDSGDAITLSVGVRGVNVRYEWRKDGEIFQEAIRAWVTHSAQTYAHVPTGPFADGWHSDPNFDISGWRPGPGGVGYELSSSKAYTPFFLIDVDADLYDKNTTTLIRIPFDLTRDDLFRANVLRLRMRYDDGFAAFLNGHRVAEANAPHALSWNSEATGSHDDALAVEFQEWDLAPFLSVLDEGNNLLAIQGLNDGRTSSDFLIQVELLGGRTYDIPALNLSNAGPEDSGDYTVTARNVSGAATSGPVSIRVADRAANSYQSWAASHWIQGSGEASGLADDSDGDGFLNGIEFLGGSDPKSAASLPAFKVRRLTEGGIDSLVVDFPGDPPAGTTSLGVEVSTSLEPGHWEALPFAGEDVGLLLNESGGGYRVRITVRKSRQFVRFAVSEEVTAD